MRKSIHRADIHRVLINHVIKRFNFYNIYIYLWIYIYKYIPTNTYL